MQILDGRLVSDKLLSDLKIQINQQQAKIKLDIILVGDDPASLKYVSIKQQKAEQVGIITKLYHLPTTVTQTEISQLINQLNHDSNVTAFILQLPLPSHLNRLNLLNQISPSKDADGLNALNLGLLFQNSPSAIPSATALGVIKLLDHYSIPLDGKNTVIVGRSIEVGLPLLAMLNNKNCTVSLCHSHTQDLQSKCLQADILISAVGQSNFIKADYVKHHATLVDIGINKHPQTGNLVGDFDFESISTKASFITPVPGGVGPMTVVSLLINTLNLWQKQQYPQITS